MIQTMLVQSHVLDFLVVGLVSNENVNASNTLSDVKRNRNHLLYARQ